MIPVVLIHRGGCPEYLDIAIRQALKLNRVVLIGDTKPDIENVSFSFVHIEKYYNAPNVPEFIDLYVHLNTTPPDYELFCYLRWFILLAFMKERSLDCSFYIDSDVMLFCNVETEYCNWNQFTMTMLHRTTPVSSYMTLKGLQDFCYMLIKIYNDKDGYDFNKIKSHFTFRQNYGLSGGVCDMTLFEWFHYHFQYGGGPGRVGEMMYIINKTTFDCNINSSDQDFEMDNGIKKIRFYQGEEGRVPLVFNNQIGQLILFNSIHFQGDAKRLMKGFYEQCK